MWLRLFLSSGSQTSACIGITRGLVKPKLQDPTSIVTDLVAVEWHQKVCISNKFSNDAVLLIWGRHSENLCSESGKCPQSIQYNTSVSVKTSGTLGQEQPFPHRGVSSGGIWRDSLPPGLFSLEVTKSPPLTKPESGSSESSCKLGPDLGLCPWPA